MNRTVRELAGRVDDGIDRLQDALAAMSPEQRRFRPDGEAWSPDMVAHHLLLAQSLAMAVVEKNRGRRSKPRNLKQRLGRVGVATLFRFGLKVKNPAPPTNPDPDLDSEELDSRWSVERERLREMTAAMDDSDLADAGFMHPISGPLSVGESLDFMACHLEHHLKQIDRIRATAAFPRGES